MPKSLSTGLALMLLAGVALAGLAGWNLLAQKSARTQTNEQGETAQQDPAVQDEQDDQQDDGPFNVRIVGDETFVDGKRVDPESDSQQTQQTQQTQQAVGGGPIDEVPGAQPTEPSPPGQQQPNEQQAAQQQAQQQTQPADQPTADGEMLSPEQVQQQFQQQLDQRAAELDQREQTLNEREQALDEREATLDERELELEQWQADLEAWEADLEDETAALEQQTSAPQQQTRAPSLELMDTSRGTVQQYEYDVPSGTTIEERPVLERPTLREPTPPMGPGEEDAPYWIFYGYY